MPFDGADSPQQRGWTVGRCRSTERIPRSSGVDRRSVPFDGADSPQQRGWVGRRSVPFAERLDRRSVPFDGADSPQQRGWTVGRCRSTERIPRSSGATEGSAGSAPSLRPAGSTSRRRFGSCCTACRQISVTFPLKPSSGSSTRRAAAFHFPPAARRNIPVSAWNIRSPTVGLTAGGGSPGPEVWPYRANLTVSAPLHGAHRNGGGDRLVASNPR